MNTIHKDNLKEFQAVFEGISSKPYLDTGGVLTIGIGHTDQSTGVFNKNSQWTAEQIEQAWLKDIDRSIKLASKWIIRDIPTPMYDMAVDLIFNAGKPRTFILMINEGNLEGARDQLLRWIYDNGKVYLGLVKRCFARYMYFNEEDWLPFAKCNATRTNIKPLNDLINPLGYRLIFDPKTQFRLQRFK